MKCLSSLACLAGIASVSAFSQKEQDAALALAAVQIKALPNAPDDYAPSTVDCPSTRPSVRIADSLSKQEKDFLSARRGKTIPAMKDFLGRANIKDFDVNNYFSSHSNNSQLPNVALAFSGGGYRALMNGAGHIQAFDSRETNGTASGHLGGLLQSATYVSGLSGGSWLVGSIFINNFTTISNLISAQSSTWHFQDSIFKGPDHHGVQIFKSADYYKTIFDTVQDKTKNYTTTMTDYWGRALSYQFVNASDGGPSYTWSSISQNPGFSQGEQPFPIVVADSRLPGEKIISRNSSIYEFNPYEFGTWDPEVYSFAPMEYIGGNFTNGTVPDDEKCVRGFDNAGFVMGTSSSLFNSFLLKLANGSESGAPQFLVNAFKDALEKVSDKEDDIASYRPHPFYKWNPTGKSAISNLTELTLVDGGLDKQNIPLHPLIQPQRAVDVIFAVDSSADTEYAWPNGHSLVATYERSLSRTVANGTSFPVVPDTNTFINLGLNARPTFFGCDAANTSATTPLVVYLPNAPLSYFSNWTTFTPSYNESERDNSILNGYNLATRSNSTADPEWPACVGCAILSRSFNRTGTNVPSQCQSCFSRYCWNGTLASHEPGTYEPKVANASATKSGAEPMLARGTVWPTAVLAAVMMAVFA